MQVNEAVLEVFDFSSSLAVYSDRALPLSDGPIAEYIQHHVDKSFLDHGCETGYMKDKWVEAIQSLGENMELTELGKSIGEELFNYMSQATEPSIMDFVLARVSADAHYLCFMLFEAHEAYTHQLFSEDDGSLATELVEYKAILPTKTQKLRTFAAINMSDLSVRMFEPKGEYDGEPCYILRDKVLGLTTSPSSKDTVRQLQKIVTKVNKAYESDGIDSAVKVKELLASNAEVSDTIKPATFIEHVFADEPAKLEAAREEIKEAHMPEELPMSRDYAQKVGRMHKIKTDTGIEISFPIEYLHNRDMIEIIRNDDGTLGIEIKQISKITNK